MTAHWLSTGIFHIGNWIWCVIIGALIILWILIGIKNLGKINTVAMTALFLLTIVLSFVIFGNGSAQNIHGEAMTIWGSSRVVCCDASVLASFDQ